MNRQHVLHNYDFSLAFAKLLCNEIDNANRCAQPHGVPNHPAWIVGHLANTSSVAGTLLGLDVSVDPTWQEKFGRGSTPVDDVSQYPDLAELLATFELTHKRVSEAFLKVDDAVFDEVTPHERLRERFPRTGQMLTFMMTSHEMFHLGQLSAWRRAMGMKSAM